MKCAYCNQENEISREHIIPKSIIDLFPECDYVYSRRPGEKVKVYKDESKIKDVCVKCNNEELSKLDDYGKKIIEKYFVSEYGRNIRLRAYP
ncbi:hypothetical protein [Clostridium sp.]|uniref:hypothetical protein n=1 Tax=Clostridium sp. TaxID=1506 RepID=UPI00284CB004|nr:hypothetical protein [Clostridium sp.]MDR3594917.1 hypothetical protein [Clostridium sp.]